MAKIGFIIPLDFNDYFITHGQRVNWCSAQNWYANQNIQLSGTISSTTAKVGDNVTVQVGIQGVTDQGFTEEAQVLHLQAWVCYPNSVPGRADETLIVHSMQPAIGGQPPALDLTANPALIFGSGDAADYQNPGPSYQLFNLAPVWTPSDLDLLPPNTTAHCCIVATSQGIADVNGDALPVGLFVSGNNLSGIDICTDPHEGQTNISIVPVSGGKNRRGGGLLGEFGFLSGAARREQRKQITVEVRPVAQGSEVDPAVLKVLKSGPWSNLALKPATSASRNFGLRKNTHECKGWLAKIIHEAEDIIEDVVEKLAGGGDHDDRNARRLKLTLPPNGLQPLVFQAELEPSELPGSVQVFDVIQTDETGERGGIRVGVVAVP